nr:MAG TPA: putative tail component [Caudoviricetes sp.]
MKIKVRLSDVGLRDAERQIQEYKTNLNKKAQKFAKALADKGLDVAKVRFANAEYAGSNDVSCRVERNGNTCTIVAEGKSVAFIEFGTGAHHNGYGGELPPGVGAHGSYGKGQGANRRWYYYGESGNAGTPVKQVDGKGQLNYTSGNDAAMAMWGAVEEMASQVDATWREVWNS